MGLAGQAFRLLKTDWRDPQLLAEELYLMLLTDRDDTTTPTSVQSGVGQDPRVLPPELSQDPFPDLNLPSLDFPAFPDNPLDLRQSPVETALDDAGGIKEQQERQTSTINHIRVVVPGKITGGGEGALYQVDLYPNSSQEATDKVAVQGVKELNGLATLSAGLWALVFRHTTFEVTKIEVVETGAGVQGEKVISTTTKVKVLAREHEMVAGGGGNSLPVQVVSGTGDTYQANAYPLGTGQPSVPVTLTVLQIDPAETIPVGSWFLATFVAGTYYVQPSIWYVG